MLTDILLLSNANVKQCQWWQCGVFLSHATLDFLSTLFQRQTLYFLLQHITHLTPFLYVFLLACSCFLSIGQNREITGIRVRESRKEPQVGPHPFCLTEGWSVPLCDKITLLLLNLNNLFKSSLWISRKMHHYRGRKYFWYFQCICI